MPVQVVMPQFDLFMTEGTIVEWLKDDGERVEEQEPIALIETVKAVVEVEAPASGILFKTQSQGSIVDVGEPLGVIVQPGEAAPRIMESSKLREDRKQPVHQATAVRENRIRASPLAKKVAKEHAIDLSHVTGTGRNGVITKRDVLTYVEQLREKTDEEEVIPLTGWRKSMADRMAYSTRTMAQLTTITETDFTDLLAMRKTLLSEGKGRVSVTAFIVKAVAEALKEYPIMNSSLIDDKIILKKHRNIGIAVARENQGLIVPVIRDADTKTIFELDQIIQGIVQKARESQLSLEDITDGTFTITNAGMLGVTLNTPIINPPESGILGVGAITKRPMVVDDQVIIRSMAYLCLSYDHRVVDGTPAIKFLQRIRQLLQAPAHLT